MQIHSKDGGATPLVSEHGEVTYELVGRGFGESSEKHSMTQAAIPAGKGSRRHSHPMAEESEYMLKGQARIQVGEEEAQVAAGQVFHE